MKKTSRLDVDVGHFAGTVRFTTPDGDIDATEGNVMIVPPKAIHTFSNPSDTEDAEIYMTSTPGEWVF